jgi:hypothetical protein
MNRDGYVAAGRRVYRKVASQTEMCPYGDKHNVGLYDLQEIAVVAEGWQDDVSGYNTGRGTAYWAADSEGRIYYRPYNGFDPGGWRRDDGVSYFDRVLSTWARDSEGNPLTAATPPWRTS